MINPSQPVHILVADDDEEDQELVRDAILAEAPAARVAVVGNGEKVFSYLAGFSNDSLPGLIVLDYKMPILNGVETLERLCSDERYSSIPVVVWSTSNRQEYIDNCLERGALRFFTKPNDPLELEQIVSGLLALVRRGD